MSGGEGMGQGSGAARGNTGAHLPCSAAPRALELEDGYAARKRRRKSQKERRRGLPTSFLQGVDVADGGRKFPGP